MWTKTKQSDVRPLSDGVRMSSPHTATTSFPSTIYAGAELSPANGCMSRTPVTAARNWPTFGTL